jgi:hypothetical protein
MIDWIVCRVETARCESRQGERESTTVQSTLWQVPSVLQLEAWRSLLEDFGREKGKRTEAHVIDVLSTSFGLFRTHSMRSVRLVVSPIPALNQMDSKL